MCNETPAPAVFYLWRLHPTAFSIFSISLRKVRVVVMNKQLLIILVLLFPLMSAAQIYRWVDENGKIHFSDRPQSGQQNEAVEVDTRRNSYGGGDVLERQRGLLDGYKKEERNEARQAQKEAQREAQEQRLKRGCLAARDRLKRYQSGALYYLNDQGERVYYSEAERAQRIAQYQQQVEQHCD